MLKLKKSLSEWLRWQEGLHPRQVDLGLERIRPVAGRLQLLEPRARVVTVAGTNGKGSAVAILESIARAAEISIGCYTSPHLLRYNERIRINGHEAEDGAICEAFEQIDQARGDISLTYFEFGTLAALYLFSRQPLDLWVLEVGLGGRLDAVNLVDADVVLLTTVDMDHQEWLGENREVIGREKAGVFREGRPAVIGEVSPPDSVLEYAALSRTPLFRYQVDFSYGKCNDSWSWNGSSSVHYTQLPIPNLAGSVQLQNCAAVLEVFSQLGWLARIGRAALVEGLRRIRLKGRFQVIDERPEVIVDVSHNPQAARMLVENLDMAVKTGRTIAVAGMLCDKKIRSVVEILAPSVDHWIAVGLDVSRGCSMEQMMAELNGVGEVECYDDPVSGLQRARSIASAVDRILVFGSFYTVAAVMAAQ